MSELLDAIDQITGAKPPPVAAVVDVASKTEDAITLKTTDLANAERLEKLHGSELRHVGTWNRWLAWDGKRWKYDDSGELMRRCADVARKLAAEAAQGVCLASELLAHNPRDEKLRDDLKKANKLFAFACASQDSKRLTAMANLGRSRASMAITHDALDADPWLFNVSNGTIDLRTGNAWPHDPTNLITKISPIEYDPTAKCPLWEAFLERAMGGSRDLVDYLQRVVGYSLTGVIREHILAFMFGGGANGKSTALGILTMLLGDYAVTAPRGLLFQRRGEAHPTELASLCGARFAVCAEVEEGQAFDEAKVKDLTGGDRISARRMHENFWSFQPTHKLFMAGNHRPVVKGDDLGIWRRIRLVPWQVTIPEDERDPALPEKLRAELPGILAWAVRGCLEWQKNGLDEPSIVREATATYRKESDLTGQWLDQCCTFGVDWTISRKSLRESYVRWCEDQGALPVGARKLAERLRARNVSETTVREGLGGPVNGWRGVRLATDVERSTKSAWGQTGSVVTLPLEGIAE